MVPTGDALEQGHGISEAGLNASIASIQVEALGSYSAGSLCSQGLASLFQSQKHGDFFHFKSRKRYAILS